MQKKAVRRELPFSFPLKRETAMLFVFMTHFLAELSVFVLRDFFSPLLYNAAHSMQPPSDNLLGKGFWI